MGESLTVAYVYCHRFQAEGDRIRADQYFTQQTWDRYLEYFGTVRLLSRVDESGNNNADKSESVIEGVSICRLPDLYSPYHSFSRYMEIKKTLYAEISEVDGVVARLPCGIGQMAIHIAEKLEKPWAVEIVGCPWDAMWNYGSVLGKLYAPFATWTTKRVVKRAAHSLYVTSKFLQSRYPCKPGANTVACSNVEIPCPQDDTIDNRLDKIRTQSTPIVLGLIGSLDTRQKGIHVVIEALGKIRDRLPPVEFRILGGGSRSEWRRLAEKHHVDDIIYFDGTLPGGGPVFAWLDNIDVYLQPSLQEGLPRGLIEAMSRGCPALGSDHAGIPELLDPECLIEPGDSDGLAKLLLRVIEDDAWKEHQAWVNWKRSHEYTTRKLALKRRLFWSRFIADIEGRLHAGK
ncbi:MAG: glycosyltransferase [Pseudomonadales bacterium]